MQDYSLKVIFKCLRLCHGHFLCLCHYHCILVGQVFFLVTPINCLKGHKSLGSLFTLPCRDMVAFRHPSGQLKKAIFRFVSARATNMRKELEIDGLGLIEESVWVKVLMQKPAWRNGGLLDAQWWNHSPHTLHYSSFLPCIFVILKH